MRRRNDVTDALPAIYPIFCRPFFYLRWIRFEGSNPYHFTVVVRQRKNVRFAARLCDLS